MTQDIFKQMKEYIGYKVTNISGKQIVIIPTVYNFDKRIKNLETKINKINTTINITISILKKIEIISMYICFGIIVYYITDLIVK